MNFALFTTLENILGTNLTHIATILAMVVASVLPLIIVAYGGMISEHSGIINLSLEGNMIFGAMAGFLVCRALTPLDADGRMIDPTVCSINPILAAIIAALVAGLVGLLSSLLLAFAAINLKANQTLIGTAINVLAAAAAIAVVHIMTGSNGELGIDTKITAPEWLNITGKTFGMDAKYFDITSVENPTGWQYLASFFSIFVFNTTFVSHFIIIILIIAVVIFMKKTKIGLRLEACGENPQACDSVGVSVTKIRYLGTCLSGFLAGIGGFAFVSMLGIFAANNGVFGFGFLALAVMIFGNWKPGVIIGSGLVFAIFRVLANYTWIQDIMFPKTEFAGIKDVFFMVPYIVTLIILIFASRRSNCPKAEGIPYEKGAR